MTADPPEKEETMKFKSMILTATTLFLLLPSLAWAKPRVELKVEALKEVKSVENGKEVTRLLPADTVKPGQVLQYTIRYTNTGDEDATRVVVNNPIPKGTVYLAETAYGYGSKITFSADGGKTFGPADTLKVTVTRADGSKTTRKAMAAEYTHIRWVITKVPAGGSGSVGFKVRVK